jgi:hypothetical protein
MLSPASLENQSFIIFTTGQIAKGEVKEIELSIPFTSQDPGEVLATSTLVLDDTCAGHFRIVDVRSDEASILPTSAYGSTSPEVDVFRTSFRRIGPGGKANRKLKVVLANTTENSHAAKGKFWFVRVVTDGVDSPTVWHAQVEKTLRPAPGILRRTGNFTLRLASAIFRLADEYEQFMDALKLMHESEDVLDTAKSPVVLAVGPKEVPPLGVMTFKLDPSQYRLNVRRLLIDPLTASNFYVVGIKAGGKFLMDFSTCREIPAWVFNEESPDFAPNTVGPDDSIELSIRNEINRTELFIGTFECDVVL